MSTQSVADRLVALCREGKNLEAIDELYGDNIVSTEPACAPTPVTTGKSAVKKKSVDWFASVEEVHGGAISDPIVASDFFTCRMDFDITFKERGRMQMEEICVFQVADDKIVAEQFFYTMGG